MNKTLWALPITLIASSVAAMSEPTILWQNLVVGMSKAEVTALYPTGKVMLTEQCEAKVVGDFSKGRLVKVVLKFGDIYAAGRGAWGQALECQKIVRASIISRYGEPTQESIRIAEGRATGEILLWELNLTLVEFYAQEGRPFTVIQYHYVPPPKPPIAPAAANKL